MESKSEASTQERLDEKPGVIDWANRNFKPAMAVLLTVFLLMAGSLWVLGEQAGAYNDFCEEYGWPLAANVNGEKSCARINDFNVEYQRCRCSFDFLVLNPSCIFIEEQSAFLIPQKNTEPLIQGDDLFGGSKD